MRLFTRPRQRIERQTTPLALTDGRTVNVAFVRHPRATRIKLSVDERGARLSLPPRTGERAALAFLQQHRDWLQGQLDALADVATAPVIAGETASLPLRGDAVPLRWAAARATRLVSDGEAGLRFDVRTLQPGASATPAMRRALRDFYEAQARSDIARWLPQYTADLPKPPSRIVFKRMASQWGSLSPAGVVALDLALVLARPAAFEYVLVHELCHLLHHDHSPRFWQAVQTRLPYWRHERAWLHAQGRQLKARLRGLLEAA